MSDVSATGDPKTGAPRRDASWRTELKRAATTDLDCQTSFHVVRAADVECVGRADFPWLIVVN